MFELKQTETFRLWRTHLKDERARALIASRLDRLAYGHSGDAAPVGKGISELRIHFGPLRPRLPHIFSEARQGGDRPALRRRQEHPGQGYQESQAARKPMEGMKCLKN